MASDSIAHSSIPNDFVRAEGCSPHRLDVIGKVSPGCGTVPQPSPPSFGQNLAEELSPAKSTSVPALSEASDELAAFKPSLSLSSTDPAEAPPPSQQVDTRPADVNRKDKVDEVTTSCDDFFSFCNMAFTMTDFTQMLPLELWAEILGRISTRDLLRFKQVNRIFRNAIHTSPLIQHRIDLFVAGLEYNPGSGISLADSRAAFVRYRSNLNPLCPIEPEILRWENLGLNNTAGGVYATTDGHLVKLFIPSSASRRIPPKEWEVEAPSLIEITDPAGYCFHPGADVIAFILPPFPFSWEVYIYLRTISDGGEHPAAQYPWIPSTCSTNEFIVRSSLITNSRLVVVIGSPHEGCDMVIRDWKSSEILFDHNYGLRSVEVEFIDDYRFLICLGSKGSEPPSLVIMDTEEKIRGGPAQTKFYFPHSGHTPSIFKRAVYTPFSTESPAPFHHDPSQRIILLTAEPYPLYLVVRVGPLLELSRDHGGTEIGWDVSGL